MLHSTNTSGAEREAAKLVIEAARQGKLEVQVVRTEHVQGKPTRTTVEQVRQCTKKAQELAEETAKRHGLAPVGGSAFQGRGLSGANASSSKEIAKIPRILAKIDKGAGMAAVGIDASCRLYDAYQVEQAYRCGQISQHERTKAHVKNTTSAAGGYAGGGLGCWGGATAGAAVGTAICPGIGTAIGGTIGGIVGAIGGYWAGNKAAEMAVDYAMGP